MNFLGEEGIGVMNWPARSPDLNPIEHCWDMLGRRVRALNHPPRTVADLITALSKVWDAIPQNALITLSEVCKIDVLSVSMPVAGIQDTETEFALVLIKLCIIGGHWKLLLSHSIYQTL